MRTTTRPNNSSASSTLSTGPTFSTGRIDRSGLGRSAARQRGAARTARLLGSLAAAAGLAGAFYLGAYQSSQEGWPFRQPEYAEKMRAAVARDATHSDRWIDELRKGGYIVYMRHAQRERWDDVTAFDALELITRADGESASYKRAVCLTDRGKEEAKLIGEAFRHLKIPVGSVVSSPSCRARQTGTLAFSKVHAVEAAILHPSAVPVADHDQFARRLREILMNTSIPEGSNLLISGHGNTLEFYGRRVVDSHDISDYRVGETGFLVLERRGDKLHVATKFESIKDLFVNGVTMGTHL